MSLPLVKSPAPPTRLAALEQPAPVARPDIDTGLRALEDVAQALQAHVLSPATKRAYASGWKTFELFCRTHGLESLPAHPETVRWFVAWLAAQIDEHHLPRYSVSTIRQKLAAVADRHLSGGLLDPTTHRAVSELVRGLSKLRGVRPERRKPLVLDDVVRIVRSMDHDVYPGGVSATRDALALWLGFTGALRRSEAAALTLQRVTLHPVDGVHLRVGKSKADQENVLPDIVVLPWGSTPETCGPCALHRWVSLMVIQQRWRDDPRVFRRAVMTQLYGYQLDTHVCGRTEAVPALVSSADLQSNRPLLRATYRNRHSARIHERGVSGDALHTMLLTRMASIGMDPTGFGFHSLRAGHVTQALRNGATRDEVMRAGRWRKAETVSVYDREYNPAARNSVMSLGL